MNGAVGTVVNITSQYVTVKFDLGLKRMVNLLSGYPDANIYGYPMNSDIIRLVLLAIYVTVHGKIGLVHACG